MKVTTDACLFGAWVAREIKNVEHPDSFGKKLIINNCLDIGAGTGLLSLMLLQKNPLIKVNAIEIDKEAAEQANENVAASPWKENISVINADVRNFVPGEKFDCIISNPPFYENELRSDNEKKNLAHHGNELKLESLLHFITKNLAEGGSFFLLLPYKRNEEIKKLFSNSQLHVASICFVRQSAKHEYFRIMLKGNCDTVKKEETEIDEISIWNDKQQYTQVFTELLKEYYLYL
jgi:tRNA1Val (adenine37-N6)-methyltransferase